jgi:hypothetical protein
MLASGMVRKIVWKKLKEHILEAIKIKLKPIIYYEKGVFQQLMISPKEDYPKISH